MAPERHARAALALLLVAACACVVVRLAGHGVEGQPNALLDQRMGAGRRSFRAALEEVPAGAGWAEVPRGTRPRGPGLRGLRASRLFAGAALYLDVNGNPMPGYYTGDPQAGAETPFWMGFRSHIDGYNVNQSPYTSPGGAQDHQEPHYPVYYSSGKPLNPVAGNAASDLEAAAGSEEPEAPKNPWEPGAINVMGAGGVSYQYPGRGGTR
eukprot:Tamp_26567.p1 GENE.Tamp_26567~~Tamp_26567.p1  ORF type:complete len:219 (+),score=22.06 Tamp_26567:28-657(+)